MSPVMAKPTDQQPREDPYAMMKKFKQESRELRDLING